MNAPSPHALSPAQNQLSHRYPDPNLIGTYIQTELEGSVEDVRIMITRPGFSPMVLSFEVVGPSRSSGQGVGCGLGFKEFKGY